jgi:hypothetical protein
VARVTHYVRHPQGNQFLAVYEERGVINAFESHEYDPKPFDLAMCRMKRQ